MKFENCKEYCSLKNNKENIRKLMKEFDCEASGKSNLIRPLVTDENGRFDEKKSGEADNRARGRHGPIWI
ncbi:MAG TPA: hypothetical protein DCX86_06165 [Coprococcus sp.]|nr:hypothetical protein [Coprococcus sp.]